MERFVYGKGLFEEPKEVTKFMSALARLCVKHGLGLSFNADHSALIVVPLDEDCMRWLMDAEMDQKVAKGLIRED